MFRFLWVAFQIESVCAQNTDHGIIESLRDLPKGLPATFRRILRQLQHSAFADPSLGRKIFEFVAAAQRPLTLDELGEAISITPGDTVWDGSRLVNDILRSLESCGSFLVVDEELSTVLFAHSSVKRHLLSKPTDLDVRDYHIDPFQADINLGRVAVTYLNLDVLGNQLSKTNGPVQMYAANVPSLVVRSALPKHDVVNKMALAILRGRKMHKKDSGLNIERSANLVSGKNTQMQQIFSFLPYCQEYWLYHSKNFHSGLDRVQWLWNRLVYGKVHTVELPWAPEHLADLGEQFVFWITKNRHDALTKRAIDELWYKRSYNSAFSDMEQLEHFLSLLPYEDSFRSLHLKPKYPRDSLLQEAAYCGYEMVVRLALQEGADINAGHEEYSNALHAAVWNGNIMIAELLIKRGANVNNRGGKYDSALQAGAATHGMDRIVELLLENGADVNALGGKHGTALAAAAGFNGVETLRLLLEAGADVNANLGVGIYTNPDNVLSVCDTALATAVARGNSAAVSVLLNAGANVNDPGNGWSPLEVAAGVRNDNILRQLLDHGALINVDLENRREYMDVFNTNIAIASEISKRKKSQIAIGSLKTPRPLERKHTFPSPSLEERGTMDR